jgi:hypothetical protein
MKRLLAALILIPISTVCTPVAVARSANGIGSNNYSGYERTGGTYSSVGASWQVPAIRFGVQGHVTSTSAEWIGIGGVVTAPIVQVGTVHQVDASGFVTDEAFYELFPAGAITIDAEPVRPGDVITASVSCASNCEPSHAGQTWTLSLQDVTQNWTWSKVFSFVSDMSSVEAIEEDSTLTGRTRFPLPNFGTVIFQNMTINGASPNLRRSEKVFMRATGGGTSIPSDPNDTRDGFNICWGDGSVDPSCPTTTTFTPPSDRN